MTSDTTKPATTPTQKPKRKKKFSQERLMIMFTLFFISGILILVLIPEGHPSRGMAMTLYSVALFWSLYRFCV